MKDIDCQDKNCDGFKDLGNSQVILPCKCCVNRHPIIKKGFELMDILENVPASEEQTDTVIALGEYIEFIDKNY